MFRLAFILYAVVGPSLMGAFMIVALVSGFDTMKYIVVAVGIGAIVGLPISYFIANAIKANE